MMDFIVIVYGKDKNTNKDCYINYEFENNKGYYPLNCREDINELLNEIKPLADFDHNIKALDICEIIDSKGNCLWGETEC